MNINGTKQLVIGGAGLIGSHVIDELVKTDVGEIVIFDNYVGFLFAILPPGAFVGLGLLIALKNACDQRITERKGKQPVVEVEAVNISGLKSQP